MNTPKSRPGATRFLVRAWVGVSDAAMLAIAVAPPFVALAIATQIG